MNFRKALQQVESHEFSARANLASDLKTFLHAISREKATKELLDITSDGKNGNKLFDRLLELARERVPLGYRNPRDTAIATYVWVLFSRTPHLGRLAAHISTLVNQCWWTSKVAEYMLLGHAVSESAISLTQFEDEYVWASSFTNEIDERPIILDSISDLVLVDQIVEPFYFHIHGLAVPAETTVLADTPPFDTNNPLSAAA